MQHFGIYLFMYASCSEDQHAQVSHWLIIVHYRLAHRSCLEVNLNSKKTKIHSWCYYSSAICVNVTWNLSWRNNCEIYGWFCAEYVFQCLLLRCSLQFCVFFTGHHSFHWLSIPIGAFVSYTMLYGTWLEYSDNIACHVRINLAGYLFMSVVFLKLSLTLFF